MQCYKIEMPDWIQQVKTLSKKYIHIPMMSSNVCQVVLLLAVAHSVLSLPLHVGSASSPSQDNKLSDDMALSMENEYLTYLYETIKESGTQPNDIGEVNLLLDGSDHFANMVQCVVPEVDSEDSEVTDSESVQRTVKYNLRQKFVISRTQTLVSVRLVIPSVQSSSLYQINVCSTTDSKSQDSSSSRYQYMDLNMEWLSKQLPYETDTVYELVLEIVSPDGSMDDDELAKILNSLKPMLVVYTYDSEFLLNLFKAPETKVVKKRDTTDALQPESQSVELPKPTLEDRKQDFCQVHTVNLTTFDHFRVPRNFEVTNPTHASMSFCYGHCRIDGSEDNAERISNHSKFVGRMSPELIDAEISPCCIPTGYNMTMISFRPRGSASLIMMIVENHVSGCSCY